MRGRAVHKTLAANYNLAKVFEEKALNALKEGDYRQAWLYTAAALQQEIEPDSTALTWQATNSLLAPDTVKAAFAEARVQSDQCRLSVNSGPTLYPH